jgi:hypothetical protein
LTADFDPKQTFPQEIHRRQCLVYTDYLGLGISHE